MKNHYFLLIIIVIITSIAIINIINTNAADSKCCLKYCVDGDPIYCSSNTTTDSCSTIDHCEFGCCTDQYGKNHSKYSKGECINKGGVFSSGPCYSVKLCESNSINSV